MGADSRAVAANRKIGINRNVNANSASARSRVAEAKAGVAVNPQSFRAFTLNARHKRHDLFGYRRRDVPMSLGILRFHKLAVVREDHVFVGVSHVEFKRGIVFEARQITRTLTDTAIRRSPDCATIGRTACFGHGARFSDQIIR